MSVPQQANKEFHAESGRRGCVEPMGPCRLLLLLITLLFLCSTLACARSTRVALGDDAATPTKSGARPPERPGESIEALEGFVRIVGQDSSHPTKGFVGVLLERNDASQWVVAYGKTRLWTLFADRHVHVTGERYHPEGHALRAPHIRLKTLRVTTPRPTDTHLAVGVEQIMLGTFETIKLPEGSKLAGETRMSFVDAGGKRYLIEHVPSKPPYGQRVQIRARRIEPSWSYEARVGGEYLWIVEVTRR